MTTWSKPSKNATQWNTVSKNPTNWNVIEGGGQDPDPEIGLNALEFNGSDQYGLVANYNGMEVGETGTLEGWVNLYNESRDGYGVAFSMITPGGAFAMYLAEDSTQQGINFNRNYSDTPADGATASELLTYSTWKHLALVFQSEQVSRVYVDGVEVEGFVFGPRSPSGSLVSTDGMQFAIARFTGTTENRWHGGIACCRLWSTARTQQEISDNMNYYLNPQHEEGLVLNLNVIEGEGDSVENTVADSNNLQLTGSPTWIEGPELSFKSY